MIDVQYMQLYIKVITHICQGLCGDQSCSSQVACENVDPGMSQDESGLKKTVCKTTPISYESL